MWWSCCVGELGEGKHLRCGWSCGIGELQCGRVVTRRRRAVGELQRLRVTLPNLNLCELIAFLAYPHFPYFQQIIINLKNSRRLSRFPLLILQLPFEKMF